MAYKVPQPKNVPQGVLDAQNAADVLERELILSMAKFYHFYLSMREIICPYDATTASYRSDFSVDRYNILFKALDQFYRRYDHKTNVPEEFGIPLPQLQACLANWITRGSIPTDMGEKLVEELADPAFFDSLTLEGANTLAECDQFSAWLKHRLTQQAFAAMSSQKHLGQLTLEKLEETVAAAKQATSSMRTDLIMNGSFMYGKRMVLPRVALPGFPKLMTAIGGGFFWGDSTLIAAINAGGKCHGIDTPIMMFDGSIKMVQDVRVGDQLMGADSKPRNVLNLARGQEEMFKVIPKKGEAWTCNRSHVLSLQAGGSQQGHTKGQTISVTVDDYLTKSSSWKNLFKLWRAPVQFPECRVPHDPYVVGVWIGNGGRHHSNVTVSDTCPETEAYLRRWADDNNMLIRDEPGRGCRTLHFRNRVRSNEQSEMRDIAELCQHEGRKIIPDAYLRNSRAVRLGVLAGLLDTDGYYHHGHYEIISVYPDLAKQIMYLARSLGYAAYSIPKTGTIKSSGFVGHYTRVTISGDFAELPILTARKKPEPRKKNKSVLRVGFEVQSLGLGDYYGFELDGDHLYLLGDFTVTHNTVLAMQFADEFVQLGYRVAVFTTERRPDELFVRSACNRMSVDITRMTKMHVVNPLEPTEQAFIPEWVFKDPQLSIIAKDMDMVYSNNMKYVDWSRGQGMNAIANFEAAMTTLERSGFDPHVVIFDWIGGGVDTIKDADILRHVFTGTAEVLVSHGKRTNRIMIAMAQLDKNKVTGTTAVIEQHMISESKAMLNNQTNVIGLTTMMDKKAGADTSAIRVFQNMCLAKSTRGLSGQVIPIELQFAHQRIVESTRIPNHHR